MSVNTAIVVLFLGQLATLALMQWLRANLLRDVQREVCDLIEVNQNLRQKYHELLKDHMDFVRATGRRAAEGIAKCCRDINLQ